jgi:phage gp36-like protein
MPAYATPQDLIARFGPDEVEQLSDIGRPRTGEIVASTLEVALADASAEIDGYLAARYPLPLDPATAPALLKVFACDIARYRLMSTRADDRVTEGYKAALIYLRDVAMGKIALFPANAAPAEPAGSAGVVMMSPGTKHWARDNTARRGGFWSADGGDW